MKKINLTNNIYGRLTVLKQVDNINKRTAWLCKCSCGIEKIIKTDNLLDNSTKSCGCLNIEKRQERGHLLSKNKIKYTPEEASARKAYTNNYKKRQPGNLTFEDFYKLTKQNCFYCEAKPSNIYNNAKSDKKSSQYAKDNGNFIYNGLDRIDNSKPHDLENVVPCCFKCNYSKRDSTLNDYCEWVKTIYNNLIIRGLIK